MPDTAAPSSCLLAPQSKCLKRCDDMINLEALSAKAATERESKKKLVQP